jgi:hypothetical protein
MRRRAAVVVSVLVTSLARTVARWLWCLNWKSKVHMIIIMSCAIIIARTVFYIANG